MLFIYIYLLFIYYLYLYNIQGIFTASVPTDTHQVSIHLKSTPLANSQMHYPLPFLGGDFFCFCPWEASLAYENSRPHSNSIYFMDPTIRIGPSIITFIIIANIYQLCQAKCLAWIILFHPHKAPCEVGTIVISIWQMRKVKPRKLNYLPKVPQLINHKPGIWPYGPLTSETKFLPSALCISCLVVYIPLFLWLLSGVYISVLIPSPSLDYKFLECKNHILFIFPLQAINRKRGKKGCWVSEWTDECFHFSTGLQLQLSESSSRPTYEVVAL